MAPEVTREMTPEDESRVVRLSLEEGYRFSVDFGDGFETLVVDEPPPLGRADGPNASALLGAAVGNCLSASLLYCLRRAHLEVEGMSAEVKVDPVRNERGRLRIGSISVCLHPAVRGASEARVARCLELFEDFCVVTDSVRNGIDVAVAVEQELLEGADPMGASDGSDGTAI